MKNYYAWGAPITVVLALIVISAPKPFGHWLFALQLLSFALQLITGIRAIRALRRDV